MQFIYNIIKDRTKKSKKKLQPHDQIQVSGKNFLHCKYLF